MKFKNIKIGDVVYIKTTVRVGWSRGKSFWVPRKVEKTTPKQFVIAGKRYRKDDGGCIGGRYSESAQLLGDDAGFGDTVKDQTAEKNYLVKNMNKVSEITSIIDQFKIDHTHPKLTEIHLKLKEVERILVEA